MTICYCLLLSVPPPPSRSYSRCARLRSCSLPRLLLSVTVSYCLPPSLPQTKIIATAVLSRLLLSRKLGLIRWRALGTLLCAVLVICHETQPSHGVDCESGAAGAGVSAAAAAEYLLGVGAVSLEAVLSGFSNVYFEKARTHR